MAWSTQAIGQPDFVADWNSMDRNTGRQIDWSLVTLLVAGKKTVKSGTVMVATASGKIVPRANRAGAETAIGLLFGTATEGQPSHSLSGYGVIIGGVIYENLLPEGVPAAAVKTELDGAGTKFAWQVYADTTEV
jgi:hypothetical protein